jgi:FkbM family methyltransferase
VRYARKKIFVTRKSVKGPIPNKFYKIKDTLAKKSFQMYLRGDGFIEGAILLKGLYGEWEKESLKIWAELSKNSQIIIDIGANTGIYSLLAQNNNSNAKIIAIEPVELNFMVLTKNVKHNKFPIILEKVALSDIDGIAKMFMLKDKLNYMTSVNDNRYALHPEIKGNTEVIEIEVPTKPYSYIHKKFNLNDLNLVKIDVEGHEVEIITAMMPYIKKYKPSILIEVIGNKNADILNNLFRESNYEFISIDEINNSVLVDRLWDNDHHNFLICQKGIRQDLQSKNLVFK